MSSSSDTRNIISGHKIPSEAYCDQPYIVRTDDGAWLVTLTTGAGKEGEHGQHIISARSTDQGRTWSRPVDIEPASGPEASWVVPLKVPSGRIYAFYTYNADNVRQVMGDSPHFKDGICTRVDTLGTYAYKYSDDGGRSWSVQRYSIPMRRFDIDRENPYQGQLLFFWGVGKPFIQDGAAFLSASKVGRLGKGFFQRSEGMLLRSDNLITEADPARHQWETLPDGDVGLRGPGGPVAEEHYVTVLSDGAFYCTYRTTDGHPCHAYSRDAGRTWTAPAYMTRTPGGQRVKHPRAANFVWKASNGRFLYWFHNNGERRYQGRNPVWLSGGIEKDGRIHWSQPEIILYDDTDPAARISYPDFVEEDGRYFLTETQKTVGRIHEIPVSLLEGMWKQGESKTIARDGLLLELRDRECANGSSRSLPASASLKTGLTIETWVKFDNLDAGQVLLDTRTPAGHGLALTLTKSNSIALTLSDESATSTWDCDPGLLMAGQWHHVVAIVDPGPRIITFVVDGVLGDGGQSRTHGWTRLAPALADLPSGNTLSIAPSLQGQLSLVRIYARYLRTSEAIANYNSGQSV